MKVTEVSIDKVILAEKSVRMHTEIQVKEFAGQKSDESAGSGSG